jgi:hypothetical protein
MQARHMKFTLCRTMPICLSILMTKAARRPRLSDYAEQYFSSPNKLAR